MAITGTVHSYKAIIIKDIEYNITVYNPLTYNVKVRKGVR